MVHRTRSDAAHGSRPWQQVLDDLNEAVVGVDRANTVVYVNTAMERLLGYGASDLIGAPLTTIIPQRFQPRHVTAFAEYIASGRSNVIGRPLVLSALRRDGTEVPIELLISATSVEGEQILIGLLRDVSERVEVEGPAGLSDILISTFAGELSLDEALAGVCASVGDRLGWDVVQLWLARSDELHLAATWARDPATSAPFERASQRTFGRDDGIPGQVWHSGVPMWIEDLVGNPDFLRREAALAAGLRSTFLFPVVAGERVRGVIELFSRDHRYPSPSLITRMAFVGRELGWFIDRRYGEERRLALLEAEQRARTDAERARERLRFLAEASSVLSQTLDLQITLKNVTTLAVPTLATWCVVHLVDGEAVKLVAAAHVDPARAGLLTEAHERYPTALAAQDGVGAVIRTGETKRWDNITDETLQRIARDDAHLELLRRLGFGSVATIPLVAHGRRIGAVSVATDVGTELDDDAVATAEELARRASTAIDNARLHHELELHAALLETQAETGVEGQVVVSAEGELLSFNRRFVDMWGFSPDVLARRSDEEALSRALEQVADPVGFITPVRDVYANPRAIRDEVILRDGRVFDRYGAPLVRGGQHLGYAWYFRDVTDQKRAEHALAEAGERMAAVARTLQQSLLPPRLPDVPGVELAARYHPSGGGTDVGGDFYDVFRLEDGWWGVAIGDVCGKGPTAAAVTAFARYTLRAVAMQVASPASALARLNDAMLREAPAGTGLFVTVAHARLRSTSHGVAVTVACGGHPLPLLRRRDGTVETVGVLGTLIGVLPEASVHDHASALEPGDALVFVTDGVLEARRYAVDGPQRLAALLQGTTGMSADEIAGLVERTALDEQDGPASDDIAVLVVQATG